MDSKYFSGTGGWNCPKCGAQASGPQCPQCRFCICAGFWPRFASTWADKGILWVLGRIFTLSRNYSLQHFWWVSILAYFMYLFYSVVCVALWGQTPGKALVKIKVVGLEGQPIGWGKAILRNSVVAVLSLWFLILEIQTIHNISPGEFSALDISDRGEFIFHHLPEQATIINYILFAFIWSEFIVIFLNRRKRALHDFIAGTLVVHDPRLPFLPWTSKKAQVRENA